MSPYSQRGLYRPEPGREELDLRILEVLFDRLPVWISYWDLDRRNVFANRAALEGVGLTQQEMRGRLLSDLLGADYERRVPYLDAAYAGTEQVFDETLALPGGDLRFTHTTLTPDTVDGEVAGLFVLASDVTSRRLAQRQMDEAQRMAHVGSWTWTLATGGMSWSDEVYRIFGVEKGSFVPTGESIYGAVHPDDVDAARTFAVESRAAGRDYRYKFRIVRPGGEVRELEAAGYPTTDDEGHTVRIDGFFQDMTEINAATHELDRINRLNTDLIGMLGHDVRGPLTVILGYLEELEESWDGLDDAMRRQMVSRVRASARRASRLVNDILTLAAAQSGAIRPSPREVRLEHLLTETLDDLPGGNEIALVMDDPATWLHVDPFHLRQIVSNLVSNALRYGAPPVSVVTANEDDEVVIAVQDHGPGVPPEALPTLYERFATTRDQAEHRGTGLGLYLVRQLVEANGGTIEYQAPTAEEPTSFVVRLPHV